MGDFELYSAEGRRVTFRDPSGGIADAAGNIDGILWQHRAQLPVLQLAHPYEDVDFTSEQAARMEAEIQFLLERESEDPSRAEIHRGIVRRGLLRLREMARWCAKHEGSHIKWRFD